MRSVQILKKCLCVILVVTTLLAIMTTAFAKSSYYVTASSLNVRSSASSFGYIKAHLKRGSVVTKISTKNGWWYVKYAGGSGYVDRHYLSSVDDKVFGSGATYKAKANLYVHTKASLDSGIIGKIKKGTKVSYIKQKGSWAYVSYNGSKGWVAAKYLKLV